MLVIEKIENEQDTYISLLSRLCVTDVDEVFRLMMMQCSLLCRPDHAKNSIQVLRNFE